MLLEALYGLALSVGGLILVIGLFEAVGLGLSGKNKND
jgi:hypothetical protein